MFCKKKVNIGGIFADTAISATGSYRPIKSTKRYIGRALIESADNYEILCFEQVCSDFFVRYTCATMVLNVLL